METKALKKQMGAAIAMVLVAAIALAASTYAWFVNNTKVTASSVDVTAKAANTLLISHGDDGKWGTTAAFKSATSSEFVPVSTVDATNFFKDTAWANETTGEYNATTFAAADATKDYYEDTFKVKASQDCGLYLDSETSFTTTDNANADVLKAMRLALVVDNKSYFYQLDAQPIIGDGNRYNTTLASMDADGVKKAISATNASDVIAASNLSTDSGVIALADGTVQAPNDNATLIKKDEKKLLCALTANTEKEVKVYIWMEGCDYDCNSTVVKNITEQAVKCQLGFCAGKNE